MTIVYTANYGNYDTIREPQISGSADFRCFTDGQGVEPYKKRAIECTLTPRRCARRAKILSNVFFPAKEVRIWHGANVQLRGDLKALIGLVKDSDIAVLKHNQRDCVYEEAEVCISWKKDDADVIRKQMSRYQQEGYPQHNGLSAAFLIVRKNTQAVRDLENLWWQEVVRGSHRDQLSFDYCCWKLGIVPTVIPGDIFSGPYHKRFPEHKGV